LRGVWKRTIDHGESLRRFLILRNQLSRNFCLLGIKGFPYQYENAAALSTGGALKIDALDLR
jgi:hypothetical protein